MEDLLAGSDEKSLEFRGARVPEAKQRLGDIFVLLSNNQLGFFSMNSLKNHEKAIYLLY